jgi:hypothetical protein
VYEAFRACKSIQQVHLERLASIRLLLPTLSNTCCCCFLYNPSYTLSYTYWLCYLYVSTYSILIEPGLYHVNWCPSCNTLIVNERPLLIILPIAGLRVLYLRESDSNSLFRFLQGIEQSISLPHLLLYIYFNVVIASNCGKSLSVLH